MLRSQYSLIPQSFFGEDISPMISSFRRAINSALQDAWEPQLSSLTQRDFYPQVSVSEDERQIRVQAELPGLKESDVEIIYEPGYLTLKGEKKEEERRESPSGLTKFSECRYGSFERRIPLRSDVQESQIQANFDRGVLTISMPKTEEARAQARRIPIRLGAAPQLEQTASKTRIQPKSEGAAAH